MAKQKKIKLTVIYGTDACNYAMEHSVNGAKRMLDSGKLDCLQGMHRTYELDTEADLEVVKQVLDDAWGWEASYFEVK